MKTRIQILSPHKEKERSNSFRPSYYARFLFLLVGRLCVRACEGNALTIIEYLQRKLTYTSLKEFGYETIKEVKWNSVVIV